MKKFWSYCLLSTIAAGPILAEALPVSFSYNGIITADIPGLATAGDGASIEIIADNGDTTLAWQIWAIEDILSATFEAGAYSATWTEDFYPAAGFATDALGQLTQAEWFGTLSSASSVDNFGPGARLFSNALALSTGLSVPYSPTLGAQLSIWSAPRFLGDPTQTPDAPTAVPEPAIAGLVMMGLLGLALRARWR